MHKLPAIAFIIAAASALACRADELTPQQRAQLLEAASRPEIKRRYDNTLHKRILKQGANEVMQINRDFDPANLSKTFEATYINTADRETGKPVQYDIDLRAQAASIRTPLQNIFAQKGFCDETVACGRDFGGAAVACGCRG